jgi:basic amino acid/polyamine antiporter, APA family
LIGGLAAANAAGVQWGAVIQNVTAFAKVATLLAVTALAAACASVTEAEAAPRLGGTALQSCAAIFAALVPAFFSFGGWQQALWIAGEVRRPKRDVPLAIIVGMLVVVAVYLLVNWAYLRVLGHAGVSMSNAIAADVVGKVWPWGGRIAAAAVAVSAFGVLNAQLLAGPRLVYAMARDGRFFAPFARASVGFGTPVPAILLIAGMALLLLTAAGEDVINRILAGVVVVDSVFFALTGAALPVLRRKLSLVPVLFVAGESCVITGALLDPQMRTAALVGAVWIAAGAACYAIFFRGRP